MKKRIAERHRSSCKRASGVRKSPAMKYVWLLLLGQFFFFFNSFAQTQNISGTVRDQEGNVLVGVTVQLKGTAMGVTTGANGKYSLKVSGERGVLVFSSIGFVTQEATIGQRNNVDITLQPSASSLNDVVVVGYGTQRKVTLTGSVSAISGKEIKTTTNTDMVNMLTGKLPGIRIAQKTGEPGNYATTFDIRGFGSPLIIVDGIPRDNNFRRMDPNEIESISILKDAAASVYGVRAANGVVIITTKKGKSGQAELNYSATYGVNQITNSPETMNAYEVALLKNEADFNNGSTTPRFSPQQLADYKSGVLPSTDWYWMGMRKYSPQTQHNLSARGGTDKVKYFISLGYLSEEGMWKTGDLGYKRYNIRSNTTAQLTRDLDVELLLYSIFENKLEPGENTFTIIKSKWFEDPTLPIYANNNPKYLQNVPGTWHPLASTNRNISGYYDGKRKEFTGILAFNYKVPFIAGLKARFQYSWAGNYYSNRRWQKKHPLYDYDAATDTYKPTYEFDPSTLREDFGEGAEVTTQTSLNYEKTLGGDHNIKALLLFEQRQFSGKNFWASRQYTLDVVDELYAGNATNQQNGSGEVTPTANQRLVGRLNYDYKLRYLLTASFAYDGSSKFAKGKRWGFFPAIEAGWRLSEENFMKDNLPVVSNLKLRASYGLLGDDGSSTFQFLSGYNYPGGNYVTEESKVTTGVGFRGISNPNLTWYESQTANIGLDIGVLENRVSATIDVFHRKRTNLLATRAFTLPGTVGAGLPQENLNSDMTKGIELSLTYSGGKRDLQYSITGNFSYARNRWLQYERAPSTNSYHNWRSNSGDRNKDVYWGYGYLGQFRSFEEIFSSPVQDGQGNRTLLPGDLKYEDYNRDGIINDNDVKPIGYVSPLPRTTFGLTLNLAWKGFDVNVLMQGAIGFFVRYTEQMEGPLFWDRGGLKIFMDRWRRADEMNPKNTEWIPGKYPSTRPVGSAAYNMNHMPSRFWLQDASYLRVKSVEIGYSIPSAILGRTIKGVRIYANGFNLLTWTGLELVDPEHTADDYGYLYPIMRNYNMGVNVTF